MGALPPNPRLTAPSRTGSRARPRPVRPRRRRSIAAWRGGPQSTDERVLRDLGDTYNRLGAHSLNIDVQRLRLKNNPSGSLTWLDARYALALAYFHTGKAKEAAQLIYSTAILHPDLGGMNCTTSLSTSVSGSGSSPDSREEPAFHSGRRIRRIGHKTARA